MAWEDTGCEGQTILWSYERLAHFLGMYPCWLCDWRLFLLWFIYQSVQSRGMSTYVASVFWILTNWLSSTVSFLRTISQALIPISGATRFNVVGLGQYLRSISNRLCSCLDTHNCLRATHWLWCNRSGTFEWTTDDPTNAYTDAEGLHIVPTLTNETTDITLDQINDGYTLNLTTDGTCTSDDGGTPCSIYSNITSGDIINPVRSARLTTKGKKTIRYGRVEVVWVNILIFVGIIEGFCVWARESTLRLLNSISANTFAGPRCPSATGYGQRFGKSCL